MLFDKLICPVSAEKIDSLAARLTGFLCSALLLAYVLTGQVAIIAVVAVDYTIRAWGKASFSPIRWIAGGILGLLKIAPKRVDLAPKIFALRVGFLFSASSLLVAFVSLKASLILAGILLFFALLDSVLDFCVGCLMYTYVVLPFRRK